MDTRCFTDPNYIDNLPDVMCEFCGYVGKSFTFPFVYGKPDEERRRLVQSRCPECDTLDTKVDVITGYDPRPKRKKRKNT